MIFFSLISFISYISLISSISLISLISLISSISSFIHGVVRYILSYYLIFNITYYLTSFSLFMVDYLNLFTMYKIQNKPCMHYYKKCLPNVAINSFIWSIPPISILSYFTNWYEFDFTFPKLLFDMLGSYVLTDFFFFTCHYILHNKYLYKLFHKKHHEIKTPIGLSAIYATVGDLYFGNILPIYLPLILFSSHYINVCIWLTLTTFNTVFMAHSGFRKLADFHDYHHKNFNKNYGTELYMDYLMGTLY